MGLSNNLISKFVKATKDEQESKKETTVYGTVRKDQNGDLRVQLDGSENILTPVKTTVVLSENDRVTVMIKNHTAIVTGNLTNPSASEGDTVRVSQLEAEKVRVNNLIAANAEIQGTLEAQDAVINSLDSTYASISYLNSNYLTANDIQTNYLSAEEIEANYLSATEIDTNYAKISRLEAAEGDINALEAVTVDITKKLTTTEAEIDDLKATKADIVSLDAALGRIDTLESDSITTAYLQSNYITASEIESTYITATRVAAEYAKITTLESDYAQVNLANVETADIGTMLANIGLITTATIVDGHITGYLDSVEVNANNITAGTLSVDRLVISGTDKSIVYELNNSGELTSSEVDTINGDVITKRTIAADHIIAGAITANELHSESVTTEKLASGAVTAGKISVTSLESIVAKIGSFTINNALYSNNHSVYNSTVDGVYIGSDYISLGNGGKTWLKNDGSVSIGDGAITYDAISDTLNVEANSINMGSKTVATTEDINNIEVGGRNLLKGTKDFSGDWNGKNTYTPSDSVNGFTVLTKNSAWTGVTQLCYLDKDKLYTFSFYAKSDIAGTIAYIYSIRNTTTNHCTLTPENLQISLTTEWKRYSLTVKCTESGYSEFRPELTASNNAIYVYGFKLESGNKVTDWTPAPEDVETRIYNTETSITQLSDRITANVTETTSLGTRVSTVEQTASDLTVQLESTRTTADTVLSRTTIKDTRDDNQNPAWYITNYPKQVVVEFKQCSAIGLTGATYCSLETVVPWPNNSGGYPKQNAWIGAKQYWRVGTDDNAWSSWMAASETATNYLNFSSSGLVIGDMTASTLGRNVLIDSDSVDIRNGETILASYGEDYIYLAKDSRAATIDLCNGLARMYHATDTKGYSQFVIDTSYALSYAKVSAPMSIPFVIENTATTNGAFIKAISNGVDIGGFGMTNDGYVARYGSDVSENFAEQYTLLDTGNFSDCMDSGWSYVGVYGDNFTQYSNNEHDKCKCRKIGKIVEIRGTASPTTNITGSSTQYTIFTLPEGYRPPYQIQQRCQGSGANTWLLTIRPDGLVNFSRYGDGSNYVDIDTSAWLPFQATFFID